MSSEKSASTKLARSRIDEIQDRLDAANTVKPPPSSESGDGLSVGPT
jgi:hypothetical protein